jgi:DNA-binding protein YbaB
MDRLYRAIEDYPRRVAELSAEVAQAARRTVTGEAGDGQVTVTLTAAGEIQSVQVSRRALRDVDNHTLAEQMVTAINAGLDAADAALGVHDADDAAANAEQDEVFNHFERRMDDLLYRLETVDRALDRLDD